MLQPDPEVPLERFDEWLRPQADITIIDLTSDDVPSIDEVGDGIIVLGGRMSSHVDLPWVADVHRLMVEATTSVPLLGICLGHQLLAEALGGEVTDEHPDGPEDGAYELTWAEAAAADPVMAGAVAMGGPVAMSHRDVVTRLPDGVVELAASDTFPAAAFRAGLAWGVQFHPEASPELLARWSALSANPDDTILERMRAVDDALQPTCRAIADGFAQVVREHAAR